MLIELKLYVYGANVKTCKDLWAWQTDSDPENKVTEQSLGPTRFGRPTTAKNRQELEPQPHQLASIRHSLNGFKQCIRI